MARRRNQEDVFKPLNDSSSDETEEALNSGRGLEVKVVLVILVLLVGAVGYVAYLKLAPADETDKVAIESTGLQPDPVGTVANQVVPATVETELGPEGQPLVMTQFSEPGETTESEAEVGWTSSMPAAAPLPQALDTEPKEDYAVNYGSPTPSDTPPSGETTFAPMPNPADFSNLSTTPNQEETTEIPTPETLLPDYSQSYAETAPTVPPVDKAISAQTPTNDPAAVSQYAAPSPTPDPAGTVNDFRVASGQEHTQVASETPSAPAYNESSGSYSQAYAMPNQEVSATPTAEPAPYGGAVASTTPTQQSHQSYLPTTPARTQADYAALSGNRTTNQRAATETWQQPTVVPVDGKYTAQPNDNFYTISTKVYGSGAYFQALAKFNADKYPSANQIRIGDVVQTPPVGTLEGRYPDLCPKPEHRDAAKQRSQAIANRSVAGRRIYVVQEGDSLFDIARFELGARSKVAELIELNRDVLGTQINYLTPGMRLVLPDNNDNAPKVTQGPTNTLR